MKNWTPQELAVLLLIGTVCAIMILIEIGILIRATATDTAESRNLLNEIVKLVIALTAGFFIGKSQPKE